MLVMKYMNQDVWAVMTVHCASRRFNRQAGEWGVQRCVRGAHSEERRPGRARRPLYGVLRGTALLIILLIVLGERDGDRVGDGASGDAGERGRAHG